MNLVSIKAAADVQLKGVKVEFLNEDKVLRGIRLTDASGRMIIVKAADTYSQSVKVMESNPFVREERHCVEAVVAGQLITKYFPTSWEADNFASEVNGELSSSNRAKVTKVDVLVDEAGAVVRRADEALADDREPADAPF